MWSGTRLGVALKTKGRFVGPVNALQGVIEQRLVSNSQSVWQAALIYGKTVILTGDHHRAVLEVLHGVIGPVVSKLHFHRSSPTGQP